MQISGLSLGLLEYQHEVDYILTLGYSVEMLLTSSLLYSVW